MALVFLASFYSLCLILLVRYIQILHWLFLCVAIRVSLWAKKLVSNSGLSLQFLDEEQAHTRGKKKKAQLFSNKSVKHYFIITLISFFFAFHRTIN